MIKDSVTYFFIFYIFKCIRIIGRKNLGEKKYRRKGEKISQKRREKNIEERERKHIKIEWTEVSYLPLKDINFPVFDVQMIPKFLHFLCQFIPFLSR